MSHEMEKNYRSGAPRAVGTEADDTATRKGGNEAQQHADAVPQPVAERGEIPADVEERVREDCRRSCRRTYWIELFKTIAKVAGVILAALGLSSFEESD